jgi:hypothetical protein
MVVTWKACSSDWNAGALLACGIDSTVDRNRKRIRFFIAKGPT